MNWKELLEACSGDIRRADYTQRFSTIPTTMQENIAQHTFYVTMYSIMIHRHLGGSPDLIGPITIFATIHDLIETLTSDFPRTFKYSSKEVLNAIEDAETILMEKFPPQIKSLYSLWESMAGKEKFYVKSVVKAADFVSLFEFMNREVLRGNKEIQPFINKMKSDLGEMHRKHLQETSDPRIQDIAELYSLMADSVGNEYYWDMTT